MARTKPRKASPDVTRITTTTTLSVGMVLAHDCSPADRLQIADLDGHVVGLCALGGTRSTHYVKRVAVRREFHIVKGS